MFARNHPLVVILSTPGLADLLLNFSLESVIPLLCVSKQFRETAVQFVLGLTAGPIGEDLRDLLDRAWICSIPGRRGFYYSRIKDYRTYWKGMVVSSRADAFVVVGARKLEAINTHKRVNLKFSFSQVNVERYRDYYEYEGFSLLPDTWDGHEAFTTVSNNESCIDHKLIWLSFTARINLMHRLLKDIPYFVESKSQNLKFVALRISPDGNVSHVAQTVGSMLQLEHLHLKAQLQEFPSSWLKLNQLRVLKLCATNISSIPSNLAASVVNLQTFHFEGPLTEFPEQLAQLESLADVNLFRTRLKNGSQLGNLEWKCVMNGSLRKFVTRPLPAWKSTRLRRLSVQANWRHGIQNLKGVLIVQSLERRRIAMKCLMKKREEERKRYDSLIRHRMRAEQQRRLLMAKAEAEEVARWRANRMNNS